MFLSIMLKAKSRPFLPIQISVLAIVLIFFLASSTDAIDTRNRTVAPQPPVNKISFHNTKKGHALLIFVHGYSSSSKGAWTNSSTKTNLLTLILRDPIYDGYDILPYEYDTNWLANKNGIEDLATDLASRINTNTIYKEYDEYFLIGHSMGGLVIKGAILHLLTHNQDHVMKNCRGVLTFGTPHSGVPKAYASSTLKKLLGITDVQNTDVKAFSSLTVKYNNQWNREVVEKNHKVPLHTFYGGDDTLVPEGSACPHYTGIFCDKIPNESHEDMVKPEDRKHITYEKIRDNVLYGFNLTSVIIYSHGNLEDTHKIIEFLRMQYNNSRQEVRSVAKSSIPFLLANQFVSYS